MQKYVEATTVAERRADDARKDLKDFVRTLAAHCTAYRRPCNRQAALQLATTLIPLVLLVAAMVWALEYSYLLVLALSLPLGGLLVRCFIIQHDCGHGSFVASRRLNDTIGRAMSVLTVTPYAMWRRVHAKHHAGSGHLEHRGAGDIRTLTVKEYLALTPAAQMRYRVYRNPIFLFLLGVPFFFVVLQRWPWGHPLPFKDVWKSVIGLDVAMLAVYGILGFVISFKALLLIALPATIVASAVGGWLFFIQHQFEETYWEDGDNWDFQVAAVMGSSYYVLPRFLNWFTGNIGLHHIHHLNSMVPNYRLPECLAASREFQTLNRIRLLESFACTRLTLWDEERNQLVGFRDL